MTWHSTAFKRIQFLYVVVVEEDGMMVDEEVVPDAMFWLIRCYQRG
jgi:hypothetical protein